MNDEEKQANCDEESDWDRPLTWRDVRGIAVIVIAMLIAVSLYDHSIRNLPWWQKSIFFALFPAVYVGCQQWWEQRSWPVEKRPSVWRLAKVVAIAAAVMYLPICAVLGAGSWLFRRYEALQWVLGLLLVVLVLVGGVWVLIDGVRSRRKQRSG